jgi:hypothetical protein
MAARQKTASALPIQAKPKRTVIGHGRRIRNNQGRTNRSPSRKAYRGQG